MNFDLVKVMCFLMICVHLVIIATVVHRKFCMSNDKQVAAVSVACIVLVFIGLLLRPA